MSRLVGEIYNGYNLPLTDDEVDIVLQVIDVLVTRNDYTCVLFQMFSGRDILTERWSWFWGQNPNDFWRLGDWVEVSRHERLLMLATFLEFEGVHP